jgi:hypothetical protein
MPEPVARPASLQGAKTMTFTIDADNDITALSPGGTIAEPGMLAFASEKELVRWGRPSRSVVCQAPQIALPCPRRRQKTIACATRD